jgi:peptidoglycan/LPS O-acetylase OafA/YrhL
VASTALAPSAASPPSTGKPVGQGYRPHLDGLRAVAVYLVIAFHAGLYRLSGGFIGVDVFFVLSGYLVTQVLMRDLDAHGGIRFRHFYARRYRRLLPAAFVALAVTSMVYAAVATPADVVEVAGSVRAAFVYVANWWFVGHATDYFGIGIEASPVLHYWSLSIEEQFYLAWPLLLGGLYVVARPAGRLRPTALRVAVGLAAGASLAGSLWLARTNPDRAYYGTDTRAYQLLAGALLALTPGLLALRPGSARTVRFLAPIPLIGLLAVSSPAIEVGPITRGVLAAGLTCLLIVAVENATGGLVQRALSLPPVVYLGRVSYATYLWHWPVIIVALRLADPAPLPLVCIATLLATGLASLSYQILERPVREARWLDGHSGTVIAAGLLVSIVAGLLVVPAMLDRDRSGATVVEGTTANGTTAVPADLDWRGARDDRPNFPDCLDDPVTRCTIVKGSGFHILVVGDSHARMLLPTFERVARRHSASLSAAVLPVCPWETGLTYPKGVDDCRAHQADWYERLVPDLDPDLVVLAHRPVDGPLGEIAMLASDGTRAERGTPEQTALVADHAAETVHRLRADGRRVLIIEPGPIAPFDPVACLSDATFLDECRYVATLEPSPVDRAYRDLDERDDGVWSMDIDRLVCPYLPICDPVVDGLIVKRDVGHLTGRYAATLAEPFERYLAAGGLLASS